ncbi:class I SAM-dependent methyltransferase [Enhygromyxa salina]|uniref:class I SAM-dependent methyltransferase n=1 Tax=Enhygromyxa salina TaxID=215803 RepID=UPI000D041DD3|nr:SAM-dependent methyltransferase [Enhygromyxa salina]
MKKHPKLARARAKLERKLIHGWERAVFSAPQAATGDHEQRVLEGPGPLQRDDPRAASLFSALMTEAETAADAGLVKHTYVIDARRRIEVDARHGHVKQRELDEQTVDKIMGGKDRALRPDRSATLLRSIGIMNPDGTISARNAKKYKQVNHLVELCRPTWTGHARERPLRIVDLACGNSYLSFVLLEALRLEGIDARLLGVDLREDVITTSRARAEQLGFGEHARFVVASLESLELDAVRDGLGGAPDLAISLHACDTATDAALTLAVRAGVESILCVPCCQAELARQLDQASARASTGAALVPAVVEQGLLRRSLGELLTDGLRVELLEACGYELGVLEFVASSHTPKNLLLRAKRIRSLAPAQWRLDPVRDRCAQLGVDPALLRALTQLAAEA